MLTEVKTMKLPVRQIPLGGLYNRVDELQQLKVRQGTIKPIHSIINIDQYVLYTFICNSSITNARFRINKR